MQNIAVIYARCLVLCKPIIRSFKRLLIYKIVVSVRPVFTLSLRSECVDRQALTNATPANETNKRVKYVRCVLAAINY